MSHSAPLHSLPAPLSPLPPSRALLFAPSQKRAAFNACYHVFNCYQTSAECAAGVPLHPDELIRHIEALQASLVLSTPALPAPVEAPGTPPLAAAAAAAPEFSDTGSQEEVMEVPGPTQLKVCMPRKEKGTQLHQYVEAVVAAYNKRAVQAAALPAGDRAAAEADLDAALALADISLATSQVGWQGAAGLWCVSVGKKGQTVREEEHWKTWDLAAACVILYIRHARASHVVAPGTAAAVRPCWGIPHWYDVACHTP